MGCIGRVESLGLHGDMPGGGRIVIPVTEQAKPKIERSQSARVAEPVGAAAVTK